MRASRPVPPLFGLVGLESSIVHDAAPVRRGRTSIFGEFSNSLAVHEQTPHDSCCSKDPH